ncbi:ComEC/Rec2 family competence protein [Novosphingobium capsulatum]|uniref:ComEC/Rec2 family competence protein n=1 Tax=Novosphingobium capsulatum TaxID=13688 RepID=UPI00078909F0|nr:MBL fold metallo-hydrolase [Novosphingobium capsulatum]WQD91884.1 MBL fold metallo-hydrolase [Novosphingobium capsulatum]
MSVVKSFAVGSGDMFYIKHGSDSFTIIDCDLSEENAGCIIAELKSESAGKGITRFICTHPDEDHFGGIEILDDAMPIANFYVVKNQALKDQDTVSFQRYCELRDGNKAFYIEKGSRRKWLNSNDDTRSGAGITILWPDLKNQHFIDALAACDAGESYNNTSAVLRYSLNGGASVMWLGDLETDFMENIVDAIELPKTTIVFAAHHGRKSGKIPDSWLEKLDPQIIVIGEAASRHLHYYTGYEKITQNMAGDITFDLSDDKVHIYVSNENYFNHDLAKKISDEKQDKFKGYFGTLTVETEYTLEPARA